MPDPPNGLRRQVIGGLMWRSGSQILAQLITWTSTFIVIRLLSSDDYGVFAMTASVMVLLSVLSGTGFASALVRSPCLEPHYVRQVFGILVLINGALIVIQFLAAPIVAAYFRQPVLADLLRTQTLVYLANPPLALAVALLNRRMDFRAQSIANIASAFAGAATALGGAVAGWGVWSLVYAPIAMVWTRAIIVAFAVKLRTVPTFRFSGAGRTLGFGTAMTITQLLWFAQSQSDIIIGGPRMTPHELGLYTTALFLAQIVTSKFIPPLNDIAYSAYARLQNDRVLVAAAFAKSVGMIATVTLPLFGGLALTAEPLVLTVLGQKWAGVIPIVRILAWAMPFVTLQILFAPVTNALGRPRLAVYGAVAGACAMPACFAIGISRGAVGLAEASLVGFPVLAAFTAIISMPVIGVNVRMLTSAMVRPVVATAVMMIAVATVDTMLPRLPVTIHLLCLAAFGFGTFASSLILLWRGSFIQLRAALF